MYVIRRIRIILYNVGVTVMMVVKGGHNGDRHCLTADNHSQGRNLPQLAFKVCENHTYYVRREDCLSKISRYVDLLNVMSMLK